LKEWVERNGEVMSPVRQTTEQPGTRRAVAGD